LNQSVVVLECGEPALSDQIKLPLTLLNAPESAVESSLTCTVI